MVNAVLRITGTLKIRTKGTLIHCSNKIDDSFKGLITSLLLYGNPGNYVYSQFTLPTSIVVLLVNNQSVVAVLPMDVVDYSDTATDVSVLYTTYQNNVNYSFNRVELWATAGTLLYRIAYYDLKTTVNVTSFIEVAWSITAITNYDVNVKYIIQQMLGTEAFNELPPSTRVNTPDFSVVLYLVASLLVPQAVLSQYRNTLYYQFRQYVGGNLGFNGVSSIEFIGATKGIKLTDACAVVSLQQGLYNVLVYYNLSGISVPFLYTTVSNVATQGITKYCVTVTFV